MSRRSLNLGTKSIEEKLKESKVEEVKEEQRIVKKVDDKIEKSKNTKTALVGSLGYPSVADRINVPTQKYKRVGVDIIEEIDEEIEGIVNNILKDKASKKDIYNEALQIGLPLWKKKLKS